MSAWAPAFRDRAEIDYWPQTGTEFTGTWRAARRAWRRRCPAGRSPGEVRRADRETDRPDGSGAELEPRPDLGDHPAPIDPLAPILMNMLRPGRIAARRSPSRAYHRRPRGGRTIAEPIPAQAERVVNSELFRVLAPTVAIRGAIGDGSYIPAARRCRSEGHIAEQNKAIDPRPMLSGPIALPEVGPRLQRGGRQHDATA